MSCCNSACSPRSLVVVVLTLVVAVLLLGTWSGPGPSSLARPNPLQSARSRAKRASRPALRESQGRPATSTRAKSIGHFEEQSAAPSASRTATPSCSGLLRVAWLNRKINLLSRPEPVLRLLQNVTGLHATLIAPDGGPFELADADVILIQANYLIDVRAVKAVHGKHALFIFVATEPLFDGNNRVDVADASFGQAPWRKGKLEEKCATAIRARNFLHMPLWLLRTMSCSGHVPVRCTIEGEIVDGSHVQPAAWAARPGFVLHIARHGGFPRELLLNALRAEGRALDLAGPARNRSVDCPGPGEGCPNIPWPPHIPDTSQGKVAFVRRYRFSLQPENSRTKCEGYMSEKVPEGERGWGALAITLPPHACAFFP